MHTQNEFIKFNDQTNSPSTFLKMKRKRGKGLKRHEINTWKYCIHIITTKKDENFWTSRNQAEVGEHNLLLFFHTLLQPGTRS